MTYSKTYLLNCIYHMQQRSLTCLYIALKWQHTYSLLLVYYYHYRICPINQWKYWDYMKFNIPCHCPANLTLQADSNCQFSTQLVSTSKTWINDQNTDNKTRTVAITKQDVSDSEVYYYISVCLYYQTIQTFYFYAEYT